MEKYKLIAPCHFGLEAVLKREIQDLGYPITLVEDGRVTFEGDAAAICRANVFLRTPERILLKVGGFHAESFEDLFQGTKAIPWEQYIPRMAGSGLQRQPESSQSCSLPETFSLL